MSESGFEKKEKKISKNNRKGLPKFLGLALLCFLLGIISGFIFADSDSPLIGRFLDLVDVARMLVQQASSWLLLAIAILLPLSCHWLLSQARKLTNDWDGENEEISDRAEKKIEWVLILSNFSMIISFFLITAMYSMGEELFENNHWIEFMIGVISFVVILIEMAVFQQKGVNLAQVLNPEKKGSIYDLNFQKEWLESCDEAERLVIGNCAYKAFRATNLTCDILMGLCAISSICFSTGLLASLVIAIIWAVNQFVYFYYALQYGKHGVKIS